MERENFDDAKSTEKRISDHHSSCLASKQPPPTHIPPLPTHITAPAHQQRLRIGRVSGLVYEDFKQTLIFLLWADFQFESIDNASACVEDNVDSYCKIRLE